MSLYLKDLTERVLVTFIEGLVGGLVLTQLTDQDMWLSALAGGVAAVTALAKGLLAKGVGMADSASLNKDV